ncbi:MAG: REP-associated tyrosine transposase, partial [Chloroflexota bacterium]
MTPETTPAGSANTPGSAGVPPVPGRSEADKARYRAGDTECTGDGRDARAPSGELSDRGWHSRYYLPHLDTAGIVQAITFRLADALPAETVAALKMQAESPRKRRQMEALLDAGLGACWLRVPQIADLMEQALLNFDGQRYRMLAWCVMPNHVHVLVKTFPEYPISRVVHTWKSFTAKRINAHLERTGTIWQADYHDRFMRTDEHLAATREYIEMNPVKAGLVATPVAWRWSSAGAPPGRSAG